MRVAEHQCFKCGVAWDGDSRECPDCGVLTGEPRYDVPTYTLIVDEDGKIVWKEE